MRLLYHRSSLLVRPSPLEFFLKSGLVLMRFFQFDIAIFVYSVLSSAHVRRDRSRSSISRPYRRLPHAEIVEAFFHRFPS